MLANILFISSSYAGFTLSKISGVWRLTGPLTGKYSLRVEKNGEQGGGCLGQATQDLVLEIQDPDNTWKEELNSLRVPASNDFQKACEIRALPMGNKVFSLRLSYPLKLGSLRTQEIASPTSLIVDHWFERPKKNQVSRTPAEFKLFEAEDKGFEDDIGWKNLIMLSGESTDLTSPELDKFRGFGLEKDIELDRRALEKRALSLPTLDFPFTETPLEFEEIPLRHRRLKSSGDKTRDKFVEGFNYVTFLFEKGEWIKARRSFEVLNSSSVKDMVDYENPYVWALLGQIDFEIYKNKKEKEYLISALDRWRTGLRKTVRSEGEATEHDVFMLTSLAKQLYKNNMHYGLASLVAWAEKYHWPAGVTEYIHFWKAEALYKLQLYNEARERYSKYFDTRNALSGRAKASDYLMAAALFRIGDSYSKEKKWKNAVEAYTRAITMAPTPGRFAFEGIWYPTILKDFSESLLNRAEANMRTAQYAAAARDYRSFMYIDGNHSYFGLALYRIAEVLRLSGAPKEKYIGAFNECVFKNAGSITDQLCRAQRAAVDMESVPENQWPRLLAEIEDIHANYDNLKHAKLFNKQELQAFAGILTASVFIKRNKPFQALARLEPNFKLEISDYLSAWSEEYTATSFAGYLEDLLQKEQPELAIENYEKRQKGWMFFRNRPEIVVRISAAFAKMGLWSEAEKSFDVARKLDKIINREESRPYDLSKDRWHYWAAKISLERAKEGYKKANEVVTHLYKLSPNVVDNHRLWVDALTSLNLGLKKDEAEKHFKAIHRLDSLSWSELEEFAKLYRALNNSKEEKILLENRVGSWFARSPASIPKNDRPQFDLMLRLAELRYENGEKDLALSLLENALLMEQHNSDGVELRARLLYNKAKVLQSMSGRQAEANQNFELVRQTAPGSYWAKMAELR